MTEQMIMRIGGWKTTSVFHRYSIINRQDMAAAMRQFEEHERHNKHSSIIVADSEAPEVTSKKLQ